VLPVISLLLSAIAVLAILTMVGGGPALWLGRRLPAPFVLAPVLGLALSAALLSTVAPVLPMAVAAWVILLPAVILSAAWALAQARMLPRPRAVDVVVPVTAGAAGFLLAALPGLVRNTLGPFGITAFDALGYIQADTWLEHHTTRDVPTGQAAHDLTLLYGHATTTGGVRIGVSLIGASIAELLHVSPDENTLPFLVALFALLPLVIWFVARLLGAGRLAAALGAAFGLSPALLSLIADSAMANLAGLALITPLLALTARAVLGRPRIAELALAALLLAGLVAIFPEFLPPVAAVLAITVIARFAVDARRGRWSWRSIRTSVAPVVGVVLPAIIVSPVAATRAIDYLRLVAGAGQNLDSLPLRHLSRENVIPWAFGTLHLYQLPRFSLLSGLEQKLVLALAAALSVLVLMTLLSRRLLTTVVVFAPVAVASVWGLTAYRRYQHHMCEYCLWKSLTFILPFLGIGVATGASALWARARRYRDFREVGAVLLVVSLAGLAGLAHGDYGVVRAEIETPASVPEDLRDLVNDVHLPPRAGLFLEAADASAAPPWSLPETYFLARHTGSRELSYASQGNASAYLAASLVVYSPGYEYVLTPFSGMLTDRKLVKRIGAFGVYRRARFDAAIVDSGWSMDPSEGTHAVPWITGPFQLWISSPVKRTVSLRLDLTGPAAGQTSFTFSADGRLLAVVGTKDRRHLCVTVPANGSSTKVFVQPAFTTPVVFPARATEQQPIGTPPKLLGLAGLHVRAGSCGDGFVDRSDLIGFGQGWYPGENSGPSLRGFRWMQSDSTLVIGGKGQRREALELETAATSLLVPRRLTVRVNGRLVGSFRIRPGWKYRELRLPIPAGVGPAVITFAARPGAQPASVVTPGDTRKLSLAFLEPTLRIVSSTGYRRARNASASRAASGVPIS
jgi:hypothetical protein